MFLSLDLFRQIPMTNRLLAGCPHTHTAYTLTQFPLRMYLVEVEGRYHDKCVCGVTSHVWDPCCRMEVFPLPQQRKSLDWTRPLFCRFRALIRFGLEFDKHNKAMWCPTCCVSSFRWHNVAFQEQLFSYGMCDVIHLFGQRVLLRWCQRFEPKVDFMFWKKMCFMAYRTWQYVEKMTNRFLALV